MLKLTDFKALLFDIDRTLTNTKSEITPETIIALNKLVQAGYTIGVCSGRGTAAIKNKILPLFPEDSIHIATGGSQLINSKGEVIWEKPIDTDTTTKLREYISNSEFAYVFMKADALYSSEPVLTNLKKHPWNFIIKNIDKMTNEGVGAIYISQLNDEIIKYIKNEPNVSFKHMVGNSGNPYIDVTAKGVTKAVTLKKWVEHTGIPTKKIIGFGDSDNDLEFLEAVGFSVAMGNATDSLKKIANKTIGHTNDNALATYLENILKGEDL